MSTKQNKTANIYCRIEPNVKQKAENILQKKGYTPSIAINLFYHKIIELGDIPFMPDWRAPRNLDFTGKTDNEIADWSLNREKSTSQKYYTLEQAKAMLDKKHGK